MFLLLAHRLAAHAIGNRLDVRGRRAAAAADEIQMAGMRELAEHLGGVLGRFVVFAEGIGQTGVRIHADVGIREPRQLFDVGTKLFDAERAIEADGDRARVAHRRPEGFHRLARERAPRGIGDRAGDDDGQIHAGRIERRAHRVDSRLGIQRIENGFDEDGVGAAVDETARGIAVGRHELIERDRAITRIVDVGRNGSRLAGRPQAAGHVAGAAQLLRFRIGDAARELHGFEVQLVHQLFEVVVGERQRSRIEGVGGDDVRAGVEELPVNVCDRAQAW